MDCFSFKGGWEVICRLLTVCFNPEKSAITAQPIHLNGLGLLAGESTGGIIFVASTKQRIAAIACVRPHLPATLG